MYYKPFSAQGKAEDQDCRLILLSHPCLADIEMHVVHSSNSEICSWPRRETDSVNRWAALIRRSVFENTRWQVRTTSYLQVAAISCTTDTTWTGVRDRLLASLSGTIRPNRQAHCHFAAWSSLAHSHEARTENVTGADNHEARLN